MNEHRVSEENMNPSSIRAMRDMEEADMCFRRVFKGREVATRKDIPPVGFINRLRWMRDKILFKEATL